MVKKKKKKFKAIHIIQIASMNSDGRLHSGILVLTLPGYTGASPTWVFYCVV